MMPHSTTHHPELPHPELVEGRTMLMQRVSLITSFPKALPMRERHRRFVLEYIIDLNGRAAAKRAGYAPGKAASRASELLRRADVQEMLRLELAAREERTRVSGDRIVLEYARIGLIDPASVAAWGPEGVTLVSSERMSADDRAAVKSISVGGRKGARAQRFELFDKLAALDALGRYTGIFGRGKGGRFAVPQHLVQGRDARDELRRKIQKMIERQAKALAKEMVAKRLAEAKALDAPAQGQDGAAKESKDDEATPHPIARAIALPLKGGGEE